MGQVLYRKYRSKNLSEIVGQEHITKTLDQALKTGRISHAYLFTGPRGVGKTSIARILAHAINDLPYIGDKPNIDIIEIDAASNRRIDEIRDLRDKVHITPSSAKYKVYIIDEVHMLTKEAFNALLKTLEEPPEHVVFILATTDAHKLPDTIISRTQRFSFKPVEKLLVVDHLKTIAKKEKITITDEALGIIADHGEGSFRDSISLLDQLSNAAEKITVDDVLNLLGIPNDKALNQIVDELELNSGLGALNSQLSDLFEQGYSPSSIAKALMNKIRDRLVNGQNKLNRDQTIALLKQLIEVESSNDPASYLLLALLEALPDSVQLKPPTIAVGIALDSITSKLESEPLPTAPKVKVEAKVTPNKSSVTVDENIWPETLNVLKKRYNTLYGIVRMATPIFRDDNQLDLVFDFAFHQKRVNDSKNKQVIADVILDVAGVSYRIECLLSGNSPKLATTSAPKVKQPSVSELENINKIFGDSELVDSL